MKLHYLVDKFKTDFDISDISLSDFKNSELYDRYKTVVVNMKIQ